MNMMKKNGGFTLVELIVVIAILAILAGIAVPAYSGYIKKAEQAGDVQILSTVNTAAQGIAVAEGAVVTGITVAADGAVTVTTTPADAVTAAEVTELTGTLEYSASTYGKGKTGELGDLCMCLMSYSDSAKTYFAQ